MSFSCPGTGQGDHVIFHFRQIQGKAHCRFKSDFVLPGIDDLRGADQYRHLFHHGIIQYDLQTAFRIPEHQCKRFGFLIFFRIDTGQVSRYALAGCDLMVFIQQFQQTAAVFMAYVQGWIAHVAGAVDRILEFQMFQGKIGSVFRKDDSHRSSGGFQQIIECIPVMDLPAVVEMDRNTRVHDFKNIAERIIVQMERPAFRMINHCHTNTLLLSL